MRQVFTAIVVMLVMNNVWANDTAVHGASGTVTPLAGEHASIRMVHETVRMDIYPQYYDVQADFLFHNTGKATTVTMGFPETGTGDGYAQYQNRTAFQYSRTTVDGKPVTAQRQLGQAPHEMSYMAWWTKEVSFAAGQQRRVTVAYRAPVGEVAGGKRWALYHFTGSNWAGTVGSSRLHVRLRLHGTYAVQSTVPLVEERDGWRAIWHDWEAEETAVISFQLCGDRDMAVRGLDIPREEDHFNWLSPRMRILHLRTPGVTDADKSVFIPPAFVNTDREGTAYISLRALKEFFAARRPDIPAPEIRWDAKSKTGAFTYLGEEMRFTTIPEPPSLEVRSSAPVPVALLRSYANFGDKRDLLYIPAETVMRRFGGNANTDYANHLLTLQFPTPETGLVTLDGKTYRIALGGNEVAVVDLATAQPRCRFAYPLPSSGQTKNTFIESLTVGSSLLLLTHNDEGAMRLHSYNIASSCATGTLVEGWQADLSSRAMLPAADQQTLYLFTMRDNTIAVEKRAMADGVVRWRRELPGVSAVNANAFIAEQDGIVALYTARRDGDGIIDPAEVILLNAENGTLRTRYWCSLEDAAPERLLRWTSGPKDTRALLNADGQLLVGTYGQGLWRTDDGKSWPRIVNEKLPTHIVSLGASRHGDIAAGTWMQDGLAFRSSLDPAFRLLAWPNQPRWPSWWSREYSRCMAVGYCGETLYVQSFGGMLRWSPRAGWERTAIPANEQVYAVINDSGIWMASAEAKTVHIRHYTPAGTSDLDAPVPVQATRIQSMTTLHGMLYLFTADGRVITCTATDLREYATALAKGRHPSWAPVIRGLLGPSAALEQGHTMSAEESVMIYTEQGYRPVIIAGTSKGPIFTDGQASASLDPSFATYGNAFTSYRDTTGDWLVMGGKDGVVMLPASVIRASLFAASNGKSIETSEIDPAK
ncbi:MAG: hypothetical protein ACYDBB_10720 [Armatimonadota bacterium]